MNTIHTARQMMARNLVLFNTQERLENTIDGVFETLTKQPKQQKIQVQRAGSHYRARYAGQAACCFGETPQEASSKLRYLPRSASGKLKFDEAML